MSNKFDNYQDGIDSDFQYNHLPTGFISFKGDGTILRVNETLSSWLGKSSTEICSLYFKSILTKGSLLYYNLVVDPLLRLKGSANEINLQFHTAEGSFDSLFNAVSYKNDKGQVILINATVLKITERKQYESQLLSEMQLAREEKRKIEFISNSVPNHIWTASGKGVLLSVNQKIKDYFGREDLSYYSGFVTIYKSDRKKALASWKSCFKQNRRFEREVRLQGLNRPPEWFLLCAEPFFDKNGKVEMWLGSGTNINKQKSMQIANYSSLSKDLQNAQKTLDANADQFVSIAMKQSHMIRKPLANIIGLVALLEQEELSENVKHLIGLLSESSAELDSMIKTVTVTMVSSPSTATPSAPINPYQLL